MLNFFLGTRRTQIMWSLITAQEYSLPGLSLAHFLSREKAQAILETVIICACMFLRYQSNPSTFHTVSREFIVFAIAVSLPYVDTALLLCIF